MLGFHIHSLSIGANHNCTAGGAHFSRFNTSHGMSRDPIMQRHVGDIDDGGHIGKGESSTTGNVGLRTACGTILLI
ncbi:unnamed protein product [Adineta steineri]|uniref:Superoxide dismutase n=1 Tax=Adineta steineri TaxID=433720 RepID=A0A814P297_9BILA|nr:unnamed protein product [Adineta steineri]CAF3742650.1 unnamed protein product [Adineta steineri]